MATLSAQPASQSTATALRLFTALLAVVLIGCQAPAAPGSSAPQSGAPTSALSVCDASSSLDLIGPDGDQVVLGDGPGGTSAWVDADGMPYFLRQIGECIWITGYVPFGESEAPFLSAFLGRLGTDFRIVGTFADVTGVLVRGYDNGVFSYRVTFDGDDVVLVEDRTDSAPPGCSGADAPCPALRELRRAES